jgi:hypothetical protein
MAQCPKAAAMSVTIKTPEEIEKMRVAGRLGSEVLDYITPFVKPGISTGELDKLCHDYMVDVQGCIPAPLNYCPPGYTPYPKSICTSINHQVCHGVPSEKVLLKKGDIVNWTSPSSRTATTATPAGCSSSAATPASAPSACARSPTSACGSASPR